MSLLDHALEYAEAGHRVLPTWGVRPDGSCQCSEAAACGSPGKHPIGRLVPHGLNDASDDADTIRSWWRQFPTANISLVTGEQFFVIDCDRSTGFDGVAKFLRLAEEAGYLDEIQETAAADTGGGGAHFLFAVDDAVEIRNQQGLLHEGVRIQGIDVRGIGGYIVAPPSVHASGKVYTWDRSLFDGVRAAPPELLSLVAGGASASSPAAGVPPGAPEPTRAASGFLVGREIPERELAEIRRALEFIPPSEDRTTWVERVAMPLHDHFAGSELGYRVFHEWCATGAGMTTPSGKPAYRGEAETQTVWRSFSTRHRNPKGIATFFEHAMSHGYTAPPAMTISGNGQATGTAPPATAFDPDELAASLAGPSDPGTFPDHLIVDLQGPLAHLVSWIIDCSRRPDPVISFAAAIGLVAGVIGRRLVGPDGTRATIAIAVLAPSGSGKDKPQECIKNLLEAHPGLGVGLLDDTPTHRTQLDDLLLRHRGQVLMVLDEYGAALQRWLKPHDTMASSMSPTIRRLATHGMTIYHLAPVSLRHPSRAADVAKWDAGIFGPAFSMVGFATPGQFYGSLSEASLIDGFLGRHVVIGTESAYDLCSPTASSIVFPDRVREWLASVQAVPVPRVGPPRAFERPPPEPGEPTAPPDMAPADPRPVPWADEAAATAWGDLVRSLDAAAHKANQDGDEALTAILRRLPGQVAVIAMVLACGEAQPVSSAAITYRHLEIAYQVAKWSADHLAWRLRHGVAHDEFGRAHLRICEQIERSAGARCYCSAFAAKAWASPYIRRIWPIVMADPRYVATEKWARLRGPDD